MDSRCMDLRLKSLTELGKEQCQADRLSSLPDELLVQILSLLPTKDVVVMCVLLRKRILPYISSLDFDASSICHCVRSPVQIERFPSFKTFVDSVLKVHPSPSLTHFRLDLGEYYMTCVEATHQPFARGCNKECFPGFKSTQINAWITFPLSRCGLRKLDLRVHLRGPPGWRKLPPEVFMKETLEVLKLDVSLNFDGVSSFNLPNLKTFHLYATLITEGAFLTNLVSSCPALEELKVSAWWKEMHFTTISSPSLRRLSLRILKLCNNISDLVILDTPNLEYLLYHDNLAAQYSITSMPCLAVATINLNSAPPMVFAETNVQILLILVKALSTVRHLSLESSCLRVLNSIEKKQLPVFHNLILLKLRMSLLFERKALVAFLYHSPNLETLVFPEGVGCLYPGSSNLTLEERMEQESRKLSLRTIPECCRFNLKRIEIFNYSGCDTDILYTQFLLKYALVLEELVVHSRIQSTLESTLQDLPRASHICSIQLLYYQSPRPGSLKGIC